MPHHGTEATPAPASLETATPGRAYPRPFRALAYRDYRLLWTGQLGWSGALWTEMVARNWLVWEMTGSGLSLGLINLSRAIPQVALALPAGVIADRFNKKRVLQSAQAVSFSCYLSLFVLVLIGAVELWHLYFFAVVMGISMSVNQPARQSLVPRLVPREVLANGIALSQVAINTNRVVGPAVAGLLIGFVGISSAYGLAAGVFLVVVITTFMMRTSEGVSLSRTQSARGQLMEGVGYALRTPAIMAIMAIAFVTFTFVMPYQTVLPIVADEVFGIGPQGYGLLLTLAGVGALAGGMAIASMEDLRRPSVVLIGGALAFGGSVVLLGVSPWVWMAFVAMPIIGASQSMFHAAGTTSLLSRTPEELHGRVLSVYTLDRGLMPLGSAMAGGLSDAFSAQAALTVMGGLATALVALVASALPAARKL